MAGLLATLSEGGNFDVSLANGGDLQLFAIPNTLTPGATGIVIVPNIAALIALSTSGMVAGSAAYVQSVNAYWNYAPASALVADGITIVAASGGGQWLRGSQAETSTALTQVAWQFDAANLSGTASDENTGLPGAPLIHKAEYARRVGGTLGGFCSPTIAATTIWQWISVGSLAQEHADELNWAMTFEVGATGLLLGPTLGSTGTPAAFTGTLLAVTAKNRALGGNPLESTFTVTSGAIVAGMLLVNATRANSVSVAAVNLGGGNWVLKQPLTPFVVGGNPTEVDTWANGDAITGYVLPNFGLENLLTTSGAGGTSSMNVQHFALGAASTDNFQITGGVVFAECVVQSGCHFSATGLANTLFGCHISSGSLEGWDMSLSGCSSATGAFMQLHSAQFSNDTTIGGTCYVAALDPNFVFSSFAILAGAVVETTVYWRGFNAIIYGAGTLDCRGIVAAVGGGTVTYNMATMLLDSVATGYSMSTAAGVTTLHGGIALSNANLVAAAGAAGFGGTATNLAGCAYTNNGAQP